VVIPVSSPIQVDLEASPSGPSPGNFVMYAWASVPNGATLTPLPAGLGDICHPIFFTGGSPAPLKTWNNLGRPGKLGTPDFPSEPAPTTLVNTMAGWPVPVTVTLQGILLDVGSAADVKASVTNAVVVDIQ
jgi:hypothetical protein